MDRHIKQNCLGHLNAHTSADHIRQCTNSVQRFEKCLYVAEMWWKIWMAICSDLLCTFKYCNRFSV